MICGCLSQRDRRLFAMRLPHAGITGMVGSYPGCGRFQRDCHCQSGLRRRRQLLKTTIMPAPPVRHAFCRKSMRGYAANNSCCSIGMAIPPTGAMNDSCQASSCDDYRILPKKKTSHRHDEVTVASGTQTRVKRKNAVWHLAGRLHYWQ